MTSSSLPLSGIIVVSIEQAVAAPFATRQLADLGAMTAAIEAVFGELTSAETLERLETAGIATEPVLAELGYEPEAIARWKQIGMI